MNEEILDFIKRRFSSTNAQWTAGNCFWFARILQARFGIRTYLDEINYFPVEGHFVFKLGETCYDCNGVFESGNPSMSLSTILHDDLSLYNRLSRDCIE